MIRTVTTIRVNEGDVDKFIDAARELVEKTNALDEGCILYTLDQSTEDPCEFAFIEAWESVEIMQGHLESEHFTRIGPVLDSMMVEGPAMTIYNQVL
ncbi:MAG: putative quinol monooxygenase [Coriobacteriales bacterium]|jgi:quinol monooxygenase YgiN